jgi:hypothetical protein
MVVLVVAEGETRMVEGNIRKWKRQHLAVSTRVTGKVEDD